MIHLLTTTIAERLSREAAMLVTVDRTEGSAPREAGTHMVVFAGDVVGTIGGGQLEFQAIIEARRRLADALADALAARGAPLRFPLGPSLGQCCGGVVWLRFERLTETDAASLPMRLREPLKPLALFGGGHVGKALVNVLATLPYAITWIDSRGEIFPPSVPTQVQCEHSDPVQAAVAGLAPGTRVLIMSFSHAEDMDIVAACLRRQAARADLPFVGLIGSKSKWATFRHRLEQRGFSDAQLAHITCPIGLPGIRGKAPEVIAVSVAAQLLMADRDSAR